MIKVINTTTNTFNLLTMTNRSHLRVLQQPVKVTSSDGDTVTYVDKYASSVSNDASVL